MMDIGDRSRRLGSEYERSVKFAYVVLNGNPSDLKYRKAA